MQTGTFCWNELATPNLEKAKEFYKTLLGWDFIDNDMGDMTYTIIKSKGEDIGGIWAIPSEKKNEIPPHWMAYILVDNIEKTMIDAEKAGATIKMPITKAGEMGRFIIVTDPTGAHIAFWESSGKSC